MASRKQRSYYVYCILSIYRGLFIAKTFRVSRRGYIDVRIDSPVESLRTTTVCEGFSHQSHLFVISVACIVTEIALSRRRSLRAIHLMTRQVNIESIA